MKYFLLCCMASMSSFLVAQESGQIIYEMTVDVHRRMTGPRAQFKEMVPQYRTVKAKMIFSKGEAVFQALKDDPQPDQFAGEARRMRFRMRNPDDIVWQDYQEGRRVEQREFMDKKFLISGQLPRLSWKLTGETKQVGPYLCQQATYQDSTEKLMAWFTPMIPVPLGPSRYGQLPGLILHLDVNEGQRTFTAVDINLEDVDVSTIKEPTKGKEVTQEEFREIMREKMKEMHQQSGQGARTRRSQH